MRPTRSRWENWVICSASSWTKRPQDDGRALRRTRCVLDIEISGVAKRLIGDGDPAWIENAIWDEEAMLWSFTIDPEIAEELLEAKGTIQISEQEGGTRRTIEGMVKVKVPFYGSKSRGLDCRGSDRGLRPGGGPPERLAWEPRHLVTLP